MTIVQTAKKLGVSSYEYIHDRVSKNFCMPSLSELIEADTKIIKFHLEFQLKGLSINFFINTHLYNLINPKITDILWNARASSIINLDNAKLFILNNFSKAIIYKK